MSSEKEEKTMAFVPAICTQCGARIKVDNSRDAGICEHCGTAFVTEKVINNYNTTVIVQGESEDDLYIIALIS